MNWRGTQTANRDRLLAKYDAAEVKLYESMGGTLTALDEDAYLSDVERVFTFRTGLSILDVGAGTGAFCKLLTRIPGLSITALEPAPAMLARLRDNAMLSSVTTIQGFCDGPHDSEHFPPGEFDVIASRQLGNGLFDPLTAFRNWHTWLSPGGAVLLVDGLYERSAWRGIWEEEVDVLPLSACQSMALTPYLLESTGFQIEAVQLMESTNRLASTKTRRYVVLARKPA